MENSNKTITVEIPEIWLVLVATQGKMGSGDLPRRMQMWAESACTKAGLEEELRQSRAEYTQELRQRLSNTLGSDSLKSLDTIIKQVLKD